MLRYFDGHGTGVWLKRYRCPGCRAVHTVRPDTHYRSFWASWKTILLCLYEKGKHNRWLCKLSRQRQQYWWRGFVKQASSQCNLQDDPLWALMKLFVQNRILSTHSSKYCEIKPFRVTTYRILAVTPPADYG